MLRAPGPGSERLTVFAVFWMLAGVCVLVWLLYDEPDPFFGHVSASMVAACVTVVLWPVALLCAWPRRRNK